MTAAMIAAAGSVLGGALGGKGSKDAAEIMNQPSWFEEAFGDEFLALGNAFFADLANTDFVGPAKDFSQYSAALASKQQYLSSFADQASSFYTGQMAAIDPATGAVNTALQQSAEYTLGQEQAQNDTAAMSTGNSGSSHAALESAATTAAVQTGLNQQIAMNTQKGINQKQDVANSYQKTASNYGSAITDTMSQSWLLDEMIAKDAQLQSINATNPAMAQLLAAQTVLGGLSGI